MKNQNQDKAMSEWKSDNFDSLNAHLYRRNDSGDGSIPYFAVGQFPIATDACLVARLLNEHAALVAVADAAEKCKRMMRHSGYLQARRASIPCSDGTFAEAYDCVLGRDRVELEDALNQLDAVRAGKKIKI